MVVREEVSAQAGHGGGVGGRLWAAEVRYRVRPGTISTALLCMIDGKGTGAASCIVPSNLQRY
jgi:hypothetical protein